MPNGIQAGGASVSRPQNAVGPASKLAPTTIQNDPRPDLDHVSLAISHSGSPLQTATRVRGIPDTEVQYRTAIRHFLGNGNDFSAAEKAFLAAGFRPQDSARIQAEEASSFFRMARDEFRRTDNELVGLTSTAGAKPTPSQQTRINNLKLQASHSFSGAVRADQLLGGLDPQRGQDLEQMEAELLAMGFPKDQVQITSRPAQP
ncbi:MAG: hypothetical protein KGR26_08720 [Cyanobacteria bacterium REEB65]|nr:hypothetical protein [Cyanobacteria bacterium REEB65]